MLDPEIIAPEEPAIAADIADRELRAQLGEVAALGGQGVEGDVVEGGQGGRMQRGRGDSASRSAAWLQHLAPSSSRTSSSLIISEAGQVSQS